MGKRSPHKVQLSLKGTRKCGRVLKGILVENTEANEENTKAAGEEERSRRRSLMYRWKRMNEGGGSSVWQRRDVHFRKSTPLLLLALYQTPKNPCFSTDL